MKLHLLYFLCTVFPVLPMDQQSIQDENSPLLHPVAISMNELSQERSALFDGSRLFYDEESYKKVRNQSIKRCLAHSCLCGLAMGAGGVLCTECISGIVWLSGFNTNGFMFCFQPGGLFCETGLLGTSAGAFGCAFMGGAVILNEKEELRDDPRKLQWNCALEVHEEMMEIADPQKRFWEYKSDISDIIKQSSNRELPPADQIREIITIREYKRNKIIKQLENRIAQTPTPIKPYEIAIALRQRGLQKEVIKIILNKIDFKSINEKSYITEQELVYILRYLKPTVNTAGWIYSPIIMQIYANHILEHKYGWISFKKSEKYPIRCDWHYFTPLSKLWSNVEKPIKCFPFSLQLAQEYAFELDPYYTREYQHPSSENMRTLLAVRQKHVERISMQRHSE